MPLAFLAWRKPLSFPFNSGPTSSELQPGCLLLLLRGSLPFSDPPSPFYSLLSWPLPMHCRAWPPQPHPMLAPAQAHARGLSPSPKGLTTQVNSLLILLLQVSFF